MAVDVQAQLQLNTTAAESKLRGLVSRVTPNATAAGSRAGGQFASAFSASVAGLAGTLGALFSFNRIFGGIRNAVSSANAIVATNIQLQGTVRAVNNRYAQQNAILTDTTKSYEQRAAAIGLTSDKIFAEEKASQSAKNATNGLERSLRLQERAFDDSIKPIERFIKNKERLIKSNRREEAAIQKTIKALEREEKQRLDLIRRQRGASTLEDEELVLDRKINQLEIQRDQLELQGLNAFFINNQIDQLEVERSLIRNKLDDIEFETKEVENQFEIKKQNANEEIALIRERRDVILNEIDIVRQDLEDRKLQFDIDIEPLKRKIEDIQDSISAASGSVSAAAPVVKDEYKDLIDELSAEAQNNPPQLFSVEDVNKSVDKILSEGIDGVDVAQIINRQSLIKSFNDTLFATQDIEKAEVLVKRFIESQAAAKSSNIDSNKAVENLGFAYRTNNSQLGNLSGIAENFATRIIPLGTQALLDQALAEGDLTTAQRLREGVLTKAEEEEAKYLGTLQVTEDTKGALVDLEEAGALELDKYRNTINETKIAIGQGLLPAFNEFLGVLTPLLEGFGEFSKNNPKVISGFAGLGVVLSAIGVLAFPLIAVFKLVAATIAAKAPVILFLKNAWAGLSLLWGALTTGGIPALISGIVTILGPVGLVVAAVGGVIAIVVLLYKRSEFVRDRLNRVFQTIRNYVTSFKDNWQERIGEIIGFFITLPIKLGLFVGKAITSIATLIWNNRDKIWAGFRTGFENVINWIKNIDLGQVLRSVGNGFRSFAIGIFKGVLGGIPGAEGFINTIESRIPKFRDGGIIDGPGDERSDSILARVSRGEAILNASAVKDLGAAKISAINQGRAGLGDETPKNVNSNSGNTINYINNGSSRFFNPLPRAVIFN